MDDRPQRGNRDSLWHPCSGLAQLDITYSYHAFGAFSLVDGVMAAIAGLIAPGRKEGWWVELLSGIASILIATEKRCYSYSSLGGTYGKIPHRGWHLLSACY